MSEWKKVRLGEVAELIAGYAFKSKWFGDYNSKVIKITDINNEGFFCAALPGVDISQLDKKKLDKYLVKRGDYVLAMTGSIGKIGKLLDGVAYINQRVLTVKASENTDHEYLYFCLKGKPFLEYMLTHIDSHSVQANISASTIGDFELPLPPLPTQRKIAAVLGALDDKIENNRKICANLEAQAQAIFKSWFVDFEPFGGKMPQGWKILPLESVCFNIRDRVGFEGAKERKVLSAIADGKLVLSEEYFTKQVYSKDIGKYIIVNEGDFAYNPARINIGSIGINDLGVGGCVSPVYVSIRVDKEYRNFFKLFFKTTYFAEEVRRRAIGSVRQLLSYPDFGMISCVYPTREYIKKFNHIYEVIVSGQRTFEHESRSLAAMRDALLPKLMSGEIDVERVKVA